MIDGMFQGLREAMHDDNLELVPEAPMVYSRRLTSNYAAHAPSDGTYGLSAGVAAER